MIGHAFTLLARDLAIGAAACTAISFGFVALLVVCRTYTERADRRHLDAIERERQSYRDQLHHHERRRTEMRCYGSGAPSAFDRWAS